MIDIIQNNKWKRPIYFSGWGQGRFPEWLEEYLCYEGMTFRLVPVSGMALNLEVLHHNLMEKYSFGGYADTNLYIDETSRSMSINYLSGFIQLALALEETGNQLKSREVKRKLIQSLPVERFRPLPQYIEHYYGQWQREEGT
jgi:hypothetical protein